MKEELKKSKEKMSETNETNRYKPVRMWVVDFDVDGTHQYALRSTKEKALTSITMYISLHSRYGWTERSDMVWEDGSGANFICARELMVDGIFR